MEEEWRKEAINIPSSKVDNDLCSTRQILALCIAGTDLFGQWHEPPQCRYKLKIRFSFSFGFKFSSKWHRSAQKGPYPLRPFSQQSPQGCPRNSANICLVEHRSFSTLEGGMSAASFLHSSFRQVLLACLFTIPPSKRATNKRAMKTTQERVMPGRMDLSHHPNKRQ